MKISRKRLNELYSINRLLVVNIKNTKIKIKKHSLLDLQHLRTDQRVPILQINQFTNFEIIELMKKKSQVINFQLQLNNKLTDSI